MTKQCKNLAIGIGFIAFIATLIIPSVLKNRGDNNEQVVIDSTGLRNGDLLLRNGRSGVSSIVTTVSQGDFSHIGLALHTSSGWQVIHAVPSETAHPDSPDILKCEAIETYYQKDRAVKGARAQVNCPDHMAQQAVQLALKKVKEHTEFDHHYNLEDTTELYCTELIWHVYKSIGIDLAENRRHEMIIPGTSNQFLFPSDIWNSRFLKKKRIFKQIKQNEY